MALLTNPNHQMAIFKRYFLRYQYLIYIVLYCGSVTWFCLLANDNFSSETYFSENALLPGLVQGNYEDENGAINLYKELRNLSSPSVPVAWLREKFKHLHMESYVQNFTINIQPILNTSIHGKNVYGILRAPRSSSTESLVLAVPYRAPISAGIGRSSGLAPGLALMLSIAKYFRHQKYWAKDIVFLVTEYEQFGMQAWLEAYHRTRCGLEGIVKSDDLDERSGAIQAAINLEIRSAVISHIDVKVMGLNGQLPNLDLANLIHKICFKEGIRHTFNNKHPMDWSSKLETMIKMSLLQGSGIPDGNHGLFHRFGIESVTLEGHPAISDDKYFHPGFQRGFREQFHRMGRVLEGVFRSLNNLLEKFHQSYFFYLLASSKNYISIGYYMPCLSAIVAIIFLKSFSIWINLQYDPQDTAQQVESKKSIPVNLFSSNMIVICAHIFGVCVTPFVYWSYRFKSPDISSEEFLYILHLIVSIIPLLLAPFIVKRCFKPSTNWFMLNMICLIELSSFFQCIAMTNFSFGYILSLIYGLPVVLVSTSINRSVKRILWIFFHPYVLLHWITFAIHLMIYAHELKIYEILIRSHTTIKEILMSNFVDYLTYGNWTQVVLNTVLLSNWLAIWCLLNMPYKFEKKIKKKVC